MTRFLALPITSLLLFSVASAQAVQPRSPLTAPQNLLTGNNFFVDFDGNGRTDVVGSFPFASSIERLADLDLTSASVTTTPIIANSVFGGGLFGGVILTEVADFDADGFYDLIVRSHSPFSGSTLFYVPGTAGGAVGTPSQFVNWLSNVWSIDSGDFDGDGDLDLIVTHSPFGTANNTLEVWRKDPNGFALAHTEALPTMSRHTTGDFNGDGYDDSAFHTGLGTARILFGHPTTLAPSTPITLPVTADRLRSAGDLNGDGLEDALVTRWQGDELHVMWGDATAGLVVGPVLLSGSSVSFQLASYTARDFDADGRIDVLAVTATPQELLVWRGDGAGTFSANPFRMAVPGNTMELVDLDLDGDLDLLSQPAATIAPVERFESRAFYGAACAGAAGDPELTIGTASPGQSGFAIGLENAAPGAFAQIIISADGTAAPCGPQVNLGTVLFPNLFGPIFTMVTDSVGNATLPVPIPANAPIGPFFVQGVILDPAGAFQLGGLAFAATRGRAIQVF